MEQDIDQTRLDNVSELIRTITAIEDDNQEKVELADLLSHFALFSAQDEDGEYNVVKVMTIHTSKGLEFDTVFVPVDCINNSRILIKGETEQMLPKLKFDVGDIVRHKVFGVGEIIKIDNITQTYEIQFRNIRGTRRIMFRAELEKVSQPD